MKSFQHIDPPDAAAALAALQSPNAEAIAGGTDLITVLKNRIREPGLLVNLKTLTDLGYIRKDEGGLRVGALTTIDAIENNPHVRDLFPGLSQAAASVGSPQIRNSGTLGGNLLQSVRCWYYRNADIHCWLKGGDTCYARQGLNRLHAILGQCPCVAVNPSDLAPALIALDAGIRTAGKAGPVEMPVAALYRLPDAGHRKQTALASGELLEGLTLPYPSADATGIYLKIMERNAWSFALVSVAVQLYWEKDAVRDSRIVLGGVAGIPWRAAAAEALLAGRRIDAALGETVAQTAVTETKPLAGNAYKVPLVRNLLARALRTLAQQRTSRPT
jgi:xanthine dehydrogenase YagS FAD-binding subunit